MRAACGCEISADARVGKFVLLDHAGGMVLGQQAVVGDNVIIMHNLTLGPCGNLSDNTVLTRDLLPYNTAVNLPARILI